MLLSARIARIQPSAGGVIVTPEPPLVATIATKRFPAVVAEGQVADMEVEPPPAVVPVTVWTRAIAASALKADPKKEKITATARNIESNFLFICDDNYTKNVLI